MQTPQTATLNDAPTLPSNASNGLPAPAPVTLAPAPAPAPLQAPTPAPAPSPTTTSVAPVAPPPPVPVVSSSIAIQVHPHGAVTNSGNSNGSTKPRPRNKMGRRPSWSEAEVLAAVQALLEHPEGLTRGAEAQAVWHQQLRASFMGKFRQQAASNPALAAREDVWANRSARKIISEARAALAACRVAHAERGHLPLPPHNSQPRLPSLHHGTNNSEEFAYPAVYDWLLRCTNQLTQQYNEDTVAGVGVGVGVGASVVTIGVDEDETTHIVPSVSMALGNGVTVGVGGQNTAVCSAITGGVGGVAAAAGGVSAGTGAGAAGGVISGGAPMAGVTNASGIPLVPRTRAPKRPRTMDGLEERTARLAAMDTETRRQNSELAVLRELFSSDAPTSEMEEFKRLLRRNALRRARVEVEDLPRGGMERS